MLMIVVLFDTGGIAVSRWSTGHVCHCGSAVKTTDRVGNHHSCWHIIWKVHYFLLSAKPNKSRLDVTKTESGMEYYYHSSVSSRQLTE